MDVLSSVALGRQLQQGDEATHVVARFPICEAHSFSIGPQNLRSEKAIEKLRAGAPDRDPTPPDETPTCTK